MNLNDALSLIRQIPDFPLPGILFHDVTPLLANPDAFRSVIKEMTSLDDKVDFVAGMEARGFIFASALAIHQNIGFIPIRKSGKLPADTYHEKYGLEYGNDELEIHQDCCNPGSKVLIVDDVLATGGTACAAINLIRRTGAEISTVAFLLEIKMLNGREKILAKFPDIQIRSLKII